MLKTVFLATASLSFFWGSTATAEGLPYPQGKVILTITGDIAQTNADGAALFDVDMLREIGETEIVTDTIWTTGTRTFTGVELADLVGFLGAEGGKISAKAINDYAVVVPISDAVEGGPIIAFEMDGKLMSRRDKGPLWLVYPYASSNDYRTEVIYSRSIWQLDRMDFFD